MGIQSAEGEQRTATEETEALRSKQRECETPDAVSALHNAHAGSTARTGSTCEAGDDAEARKVHGKLGKPRSLLPELDSTLPSTETVSTTEANQQSSHNDETQNSSWKPIAISLERDCIRASLMQASILKRGCELGLASRE